MSTLLFSRDTVLRTDSPVIFQTLVQALFSLYPPLSSNPDDFGTIQALISEVLSGGTGLLQIDAIEQEFDSPFSPNDSEQKIREILATESVARCIANGSIPSRSWMLCNLLEVQCGQLCSILIAHIQQEFWPLYLPTTLMTPLLMRVQSRKINVFARAALQLLMSGHTASAKENCDVILRIVKTRILPEIAVFASSDVEETKSLVIRLLLQVLCTEVSVIGAQKATSIINQWLNDASNWKIEVEKSLSLLV
jgi:hypothetical protein